MLTLIIDFFKREYRDQYFSKWVWLSSILVSFINICIYWFTSVAFGPKLEFSEAVAGDFFTFILVGENALLIPISLLTCFSQALRTCAGDGLLDVVLVSKTSLLRIIIYMGLSFLAFQGLQILLTLFFASALFQLSLVYFHIFDYLLLLLLCFPLFVSFGILNAALIMYLRRGFNFFVTFSMVLSILSGAYFPMEAFPRWMEEVLRFSPFATFLRWSRQILSGQIRVGDLFIPLLLFFGVGLVLFYLSTLVFRLSLVQYQRRGDPKLFWR